MEKISVVIRTFNEEAWIGLVLKQILKQKTEREVEIVIVDNKSTDRTVDRALSICPDVKYTEINDFFPGKALNLGVEASSGDYVVFLSAHCVPVDEYWIDNLVKSLKEDSVVACYGRQVPVESTSALDKRDLWITFGIEDRYQIVDSFFHNANSAMLRSYACQYPFDESVTNLEDRVWSCEQLKNGNVIKYSANATVFHHHGIHHGASESRAKKVVAVMEELHRDDTNYSGFRSLIDDVSRCIVFPISSRYDKADIKSLESKLDSLQKLEKHGWNVVIATSTTEQGKRCRELGLSVCEARDYSDVQAIPPLVEDISVIVEFFDMKSQYFDFFGFADIRKFDLSPDGLDSVLRALWHSDACLAVAAIHSRSHKMNIVNMSDFQGNQAVMSRGRWGDNLMAENENVIIDPARLILGTQSAYRRKNIFDQPVFLYSLSGKL
ncbi:glycosyltransferase [Litorivicinus sp.]|nr:glycosyltransferase [Litorivicinus sp.]